MKTDKDEQCHFLSSLTDIKMKVHAGKHDHYLVNWGKGLSKNENEDLTLRKKQDRCQKIHIHTHEPAQ